MSAGRRSAAGHRGVLRVLSLLRRNRGFTIGEAYFLAVSPVLRAEATPDELMGRVSGAGNLLAQAAAGIAVAWIGPALQCAGGAGAVALLAALAAALPTWIAVARPLAAGAPP